MIPLVRNYQPRRLGSRLGSWNDDAKAAMLANPDYFVWWYTVKSLLLVGTAVVLAFTLGRRKRRLSR